MLRAGARLILLLEHFFDLPNLFFNLADVLYHSGMVDRNVRGTLIEIGYRIAASFHYTPTGPTVANLRNEANKSFVINGSKFEVVLPFHMPTTAEVATS